MGRRVWGEEGGEEGGEEVGTHGGKARPRPDPEQDVCDIAASVEGGSHAAICDLIVLKAAERWEEEEGDYRDDITAVVVTFPWLPDGSA